MVYLGHVTHFGHKNVTGAKISNWSSGYRTFDSIEEMDKELLYQINKYVKKDDHLIHLGDFAYLNRREEWKYRDDIICDNIYMLRGNHYSERGLQKINFHIIADEIDLTINDKLHLFLSHYSHRIWNHSHKGVIHLFGHSHGSLDNKPWGKSMDVGVDSAYSLFGEYRPFNLNEILDIMKNKETLFLDHHNSKTNE